MEKSALLIINGQYGFFENTEAEPLFKGKSLLKNLKKLIQHATHKNWLVIIIKQDGNKGSIVEKDTEGWVVHPELQNDSTIVISKSTPSAFEGTKLQNILKSKDINTIFLAGLQSEVCIRATSLSATAKNYKVFLVNDAHSTWNNKNSTACEIIQSENISFEKRQLGVINVSEFLTL